MRSLAFAIAFSAAAFLGAALPAQAGGNDSDATGGFPIIPSAPGPGQMLDNVLQRLRAHDARGADTEIEAAQNRLINESLSGVRPQGENPSALRAAVPILDQARQALARGDEAEATRAATEARSLL